jgi:hypothetical protein
MDGWISRAAVTFASGAMMVSQNHPVLLGTLCACHTPAQWPRTTATTTYHRKQRMHVPYSVASYLECCFCAAYSPAQIGRGKLADGAASEGGAVCRDRQVL